MRRVVQVLLGIVAVVVILVIIALVVLTQTDVGRSRVRSLALDFLRDRIAGRAQVGRIDGNLLGEFTVSHIVISDSAGQPFLVLDSARVDLDLTALLSRRITISDLTLVRPLVVLTKAPGAAWNVQRIFDTGPDTVRDTTRGFGDWVTLIDVAVVNGRVVVQQPWTPDSTLAPAARDRAAAAALGGAGRTRVRRVRGVPMQVMDYRSIDAKLPWILAANPDSNAVLLRVASLDLVAEPFQPPAATVEDLRAVVRIASDTLLVRDATLRLPASRITGDARYLMASGVLQLDLRADTVSLADLRWLYPRLPGGGGGSLTLRAAIGGDGPSEYRVRDARLQHGDARIAGDFGLALGDRVTRFIDTDVHVVGVSTQLIERLVPGLDTRVAGVIREGTARLDGPIGAMQVAVEAEFDPARAAPAHVAARGRLGLGDPISARDLRLAIDSLPLEVVRQFAPSVPIGGTVSARATVNGSLEQRLTGAFELVHHARGRTSRVFGAGTVIDPRGRTRMNLDLRLAPLSLAVVEPFAGGRELRGDVSGLVRVRGTPRDLAMRANLSLPSGMVEAEGSLNLQGREPAYAATFTMQQVDVASVAPALPRVVLTGAGRFDGRGTDPATMDARFAARFGEVLVDTTPVTDMRAVAATRDGLLTVDTLHLNVGFSSASASGTFGIIPERTGSLSYEMRVDSLARLARWLALTDTTTVEPRPLRAAQVRGIGRDSIGGTIRTSGTMVGNVSRFTARGEANASGVVWAGSEVLRGRVEYAWVDALTERPSFVVAAALDSVRAVGFALDSVRTQATYTKPSGAVDVAIFPGDTARYVASTEFTYAAGEGSLRLRDIELVLDSTTWVSASPSRVRWGGRGIGIESLDLRARGREGRILVDGHIPSEGTGTLAVTLDGVQIADWLAVLQTDVRATGQATLRARIDGTLSRPVIRGAVGVVDATYHGAPFPAVRAAFEYADRRLVADGAVIRGTAELATIEASVPVDLALADAGPRLPGGPLRVDLEGDSIPLAPLGDLTDAISNVHGSAAGLVAVRGTTARPAIAGGLVATLSTLGIGPLGVTLRDLRGLVRMAGDSMIIDSLRARSVGTIRAKGTVDLARLSAPRVDMDVSAEDARVLDNERGELFADARLGVEGTPADLAITGRATILRGVVYLPEPAQQDVLGINDPRILAVMDTARARDLELDVVRPNPLRNLEVNVDLSVSRSTWVRSSDANVEVYGDLAVRLDREHDRTTLRGTLFTERGDYTFAGRRFVVTNGSVQFIGDPDIDPAVQVQGRHEVRLAGRSPLEIRVLVGGMLRDLRVSLESDAQPPLSQSDLIAYLAFGRSTASLLEVPGSSLQSGGESGSRLVGNVAALATRQLATLALGALVEEVEDDVASSTGADVLNITPAQVPAELSLRGMGVLLRGTEVEIGKYFDRRTFVAAEVRPTLTLPGVRFARLLSPQATLRATLESRFVPLRPTLTTGTRPETVRVLGATLTWRLGW